VAILDQSQIKYILERLEQIEYGSINITVHEGKVTQVDTTEKSRFETKNKPKKVRQS
jgi:hypothetical protein